MTAVRTRTRPAGRSRSTAPARARTGSTRTSRTRTPGARSARPPAQSSRTGGARSNRSRTAARSLPQETTGPRLRVLPRRRVSGRALLGMSAALFFVVLAGAVTIQAQRIEAQHRIDQLDTELLRADELHRVLRAEVAVAESPERVMQAAHELGMVEPGPVLPLVPPIEGDPSPDAAVAAGGAAADAGPVALGPSGDERTGTTQDPKVAVAGE